MTFSPVDLLDALSKDIGSPLRHMPRPQRRSVMYGFPMVVLEPGETLPSKVDLTEPFKPSKLVLVGFMDEVRGHFKVKRTRLPLLNRDHVIAYSNVTRVAKNRRTTIEYREHSKGNFVRTYLPESVEYTHVDPLSYITLNNLACDDIGTMQGMEASPSALFFGSSNFGNGLPLPTTRNSITLLLKNHGDIQVRVAASIFGTGYSQ